MTVKIVPQWHGMYTVEDTDTGVTFAAHSHEEALALRASLLEDSKQDIDTYEGAIEYDQGAEVNV